MLKVILIVLAILFIAFLSYWFIGRPWSDRWGATAAEMSMALPGEDLVPEAQPITTRGITIAAPVEAVYPWLLQLGQGRGGFYSYDWLENLVGCDIHSVNAIVPELQNPQIGDEMRLAPFATLPYYKFVLLKKNEAVVLRSIEPGSGKSSTELWMFTLQAVDAHTSRLVIRHCNVEQPGTFGYFITKAIFDPMAFIMVRGMMRGIRARAEG